MYCKKCGTQLEENAVSCPNCGTPTKEKAAIPDEARLGLVLWSFLLPPLGFFVDLCFEDIQPHKAKACKTAAWGGLLAWGIIVIGIMLQGIL